MAFFLRKKPKPVKALRVGLVNRLESRTPQRTQDVVSVLVLTQIFEAPYHYDEAKQETIPLLFAEPLRQDGPQTFSAPVRSGVLFSDGEPMTASSVVASLAQSEPFCEQATARAEGSRVIFDLKQPNPRFDLALTQMYCAVVRVGSSGELRGTGPYVIADEATDGTIRLSRNEHYRDEAPVGEIVFSVYPADAEGNKEALIRAVNEGLVDYTNALSRDEVSQLSEIRKSFQPGSSTMVLFLNTSRPHFRPVAVRQALAHAIDRPELTKLSYENALAFTATSLLHPAMGTWRDGIRANPERAQASLEESGVALPPRLTLLTVWGPRPYIPHPERVANAVADQLATLGVSVDVQIASSAEEYFERLCIADFDLVLGGWTADTADPADFLEALLSSERIPELGKSAAIRANVSHWSDPETDQLLAQFRRDPTHANRVKVLELVAEKVPLVPVMYGPTITVSSWRVRNLTPVSIGFPCFSAVDVGD